VTVVVLDYGSGNLRSAERALARAGADVTVTADLDRARSADGLVVPGVGAYAACVAGIDAIDAGPVIRDRVESGRPVLGICVGMQVLFDAGDEHGVVTKGLGLLPGEVRRLRAPVLPHMGWNTVAPPPGSAVAIDTATGAAVPASTPAVAAPPAEIRAPARPAIAAPLTGIWYASPAPGSAPFVEVGREVAVGQVVGLIEAMKLFNEIKSDLAGRVIRVVPETGTLVKAKQPLIEVEPL